MPVEYKWKIVMLGDFAVGKTSLVRRYVYDEFSDTYLTTIGVKVTKKEILINNDSASLLLWDIAGSDRFTSISAEYLRGSSAAVIVADITRGHTVENIRSHIDLALSVNPSAGIAIAINKVDLVNQGDERLLRIRSEEFRKSLGCDPEIYFTSAMNGENVESLFISLAEVILKEGHDEQ